MFCKIPLGLGTDSVSVVGGVHMGWERRWPETHTLARLFGVSHMGGIYAHENGSVLHI